MGGQERLDVRLYERDLAVKKNLMLPAASSEAFVYHSSKEN